MVNVVDDLLGVHQRDEVLDDGYDILVGQDADIGIDLKAELLIDTVAADLAEVIALVREEEALEDLACALLIGRLLVAELTIDVVESVVLGVTGVLLQRVEDEAEV